jgi:hypothetical protein
LSPSSTSGNSGNAIGQLHHLTEEESEDAVSANVTDDEVLTASPNNTNETELHYFKTD